LLTLAAKRTDEVNPYATVPKQNKSKQVNLYATVQKQTKTKGNYATVQNKTKQTSESIRNRSKTKRNKTMQNTICVNALRHREPVRAERIRCDICVSALRHRRKNPSGQSASDASGMLGGGWDGMARCPFLF